MTAARLAAAARVRRERLLGLAEGVAAGGAETEVVATTVSAPAAGRQGWDRVTGRDEEGALARARAAAGRPEGVPELAEAALAWEEAERGACLGAVAAMRAGAG